jgi:hypothetical protein
MEGVFTIVAKNALEKEYSFKNILFHGGKKHTTE